MLRALIRTLTLASAFAAPVVWAAEVDTLLDQAIVGDHRAEANRARDRYRHPKETLQFFGLKPDMTVVEIWPATGWFTEVLAPVLRDQGRLYAARSAVSVGTPSDFVKQRDQAFLAKLASRPDAYGKVVPTEILAPTLLEPAPRGSADMVLTFRNVHNWAKAGFVDAMFKAFFATLKPGGVLGVEEHRAKPGTSFEDQVKSGYMTEQFVIETAEKAGFRFVAKAEINANPKDTKDYAGGVWTLPPTLRLGDQDKDKYLAIGESDRMTLKFIKPM